MRKIRQGTQGRTGASGPAVSAVVASALLIGAAAVAGYTLGRSTAPTAKDAAEERGKAIAAVKDTAYSRAYAASNARGRRIGNAQGQRSGRIAGTRAAERRLARQRAAARQQARAQQSACPPGQQLLTKMGVRYCGRPGPAQPEDCPPGEEPVGITGACGPRQ